MFIIFEGADKTGKSTLIKKLNEVTDYKHWVLDRGIISSIVYNDIYKRKNKRNESFDYFYIFKHRKNRR